MILCPINPQPEHNTDSFVPAWEAILRSQKQPATEWLLITQSDHAALAGEMASRISHAAFPLLDADVLQAIALHDYGWNEVDNVGSIKVGGRGRPLSFFEEAPSDIFRAWRGSIERAAEVAPIGGILVSEHFCRIAYDFAHAPSTPSEVVQALTTFLERERDHQEDLRDKQSLSSEEIRVLVDALQFCDLLSLYVCCGARESIEFPQKFGGQTIRLRRNNESYLVEPALFGAGVSLAIEAYKFPVSGSGVATVPVLMG
jgi:hypothetical protein